MKYIIDFDPKTNDVMIDVNQYPNHPGCYYDSTISFDRTHLFIHPIDDMSKITAKYLFEEIESVTIKM